LRTGISIARHQQRLSSADPRVCAASLSPVAELPEGASLGLVDAVRSMLSLLLNGLEIVLEDRRH
jgi:hypothetical protein